MEETKNFFGIFSRSILVIFRQFNWSLNYVEEGTDWLNFRERIFDVVSKEVVV